jgi:methyl-accepting chemotaxis protein
VHLEKRIIGYAPIIDVESPKGFLVFAIDIPIELEATATSLLSKESNSLNDSDYKSVKHSSKSFSGKVLSTVIAIMIPILLLICGILWITSRSIVQPLKIAVDTANKLKEGNLSMDVEVKSRDETGHLLQVIKNVIEKLRHVVIEVKSAADNVSSGSQQMSSNSSQMSEGATEQAASAEEAASSMEQMAATLNKTQGHLKRWHLQQKSCQVRQYSFRIQSHFLKSETAMVEQRRMPGFLQQCL